MNVVGGRARRRGGRSPGRAPGRTRAEYLRQAGIGDRVWPLVQHALDTGVPRDQVLIEFDKATNEAGDAVAGDLRRRAPQMLREHRAIRRGMNRRMQAIWGPAFDAFYEVYVCVEELGSDLQQLHDGHGNDLVTALLALHARTCLALAEVHALVVQGFPLGAWARTRTLHETAVVAALLSNHGREPGADDLGERFLCHAVIDESRDLELATHAGVVIDEAELNDVRARKAALVKRFGSMFAKDYGWARPLFPTLGPRERLTFDRLEELADSGLDRLDYRVGSHHVHSSAWAVMLNEVSRGDTVYRLTGPTNLAFGEPASVALVAAMVSMAATVYGVEELPEPMHLAGLRALQTLALRTVELFAEGQALVDHREARVQSRLRGEQHVTEVCAW